jgi:hypothetical protein
LRRVREKIVVFIYGGRIYENKTFIFIVLLTLFAVSCGKTETGDVNSTTGVGEEQTSQNEQPTQPEFVPAENADYGGYKFRILGYDGEAKGIWQIAAISEIVASEESGEPINDAIYKRNREVEQLLHIEFGLVPVTYPNRGDFAAKFTKAVLAGEDLFDPPFCSGIPSPPH